jgi:hypothetical protein
MHLCTMQEAGVAVGQGLQDPPVAAPEELGHQGTPVVTPAQLTVLIEDQDLRGQQQSRAGQSRATFYSWTCALCRYGSGSTVSCCGLTGAAALEWC